MARAWTTTTKAKSVTLASAAMLAWSSSARAAEIMRFPSSSLAQSEAGTAQSEAGTASSEAGTAQSEAGTASSEAGTASSEAGTASSEAGTAQSEAGSAQSEAGTAQSEVGTARSEAGTPSAPIVVVEGSGFYKPFASWLVMPSSIVTATDELVRAFAEARSLLPPEQASALPAVDDGTVPEHIGLSTHTLRLATTAHVLDVVDVSAAWQAAAIIASSPLFVAGSGGLFGTSTSAPQRRLVDFDPILLADGGLALQQNLDQLNVAVHTSSVNVVVGRQVVSWGAGQLWNPTDLFSPFAPTDVDREARRGADAARVSIALGETSELDVLWLPQQELVDNGAVLRARTNVFDGVDLSATAAKYVDDLVLGADAAGDAGPFGLHAEAAWTLPLANALAAPERGLDVDKLDLDDSFLRAVAGVSMRPTETWTVIAEYYFNGFGAEHADEYVEKLRSDRVARGEVFGAGRHYVGVASAWALSDLTTLATTAVANVVDPSVILVVAVEHSFDQHVLLRAGANVPFGVGVDTTLFRGLSGSDVLSGSETLNRATTTFGARSEYGLSPVSLFVQLGAYFG